MAKSSNITLSRIILGVITDVLFFPFWWYSFGLLNVIRRLAKFVADREKSLALFVWLKNIFVPMYGQRDWQGFLISFFIRLVQIIFRSIILIFWLIVALAAFWLWVALPLFVAYMIIWQLTAS